MTAAEFSFEESLVVRLARRAPKRVAAAGLEALQRRRAMDAAEEAGLILRMAELCPVDDDPRRITRARRSAAGPRTKRTTGSASSSSTNSR